MARFMRMVRSPVVWFGLLIIGLACYRFSLIHAGHFYWGDERCYLAASGLVDAVAAGEYRAAAQLLYDGGAGRPPARPGFVLVSAISVLAQRGIGGLFGIDRNTPEYYDIASGFNVLVTLGVSALVFALGRVWTGRGWAGLLIAVVYSLLCNANVWIRHMVAYPESLFFFLLALWLLSSVSRPDRPGVARVVVAGLLTALGYACYPGHYAFVIINTVVALAPARRRLPSAAAFCLSCASVVGVFELLARVAGRSYVQDLRALSGTVTMGYPREGYVFVWHYLRDVEGIVGVMLFALFCGFVAFVLRRRDARIPRTARAAMIAAVACYLFHASLGVLLGKPVFYGRVLMVYLPFMVGGAVLALMHVDRIGSRRLATCGLLLTSLYSFFSFASRYGRVVYPADFLQDTMTRIGRHVSYPPNVLWDLPNGVPGRTVEALDPELLTVVDPRPDGSDVFVRLASHDEARTSRARFIGVNLKFLWYVRGRYDRFTPPDGYRLVAEALHPEVFPATGYEGRKPWERARIRRRKYTMRIYERLADGEQLTSSSGI